jgi:hypothetical protein
MKMLTKENNLQKPTTMITLSSRGEATIKAKKPNKRRKNVWKLYDLKLTIKLEIRCNSNFQ